MGVSRDDELDLIKQVISLEVMSGQVMIMRKEIKEDTKALSLEYRNYRKDMDVRLNGLERFQHDLEQMNVRDRLEDLERKERKLTGGWQGLMIALAVAWAIFSEDIKKIFH